MQESLCHKRWKKAIIKIWPNSRLTEMFCSNEVKWNQQCTIWYQISYWINNHLSHEILNLNCNNWGLEKKKKKVSTNSHCNWNTNLHITFLWLTASPSTKKNHKNNKHTIINIVTITKWVIMSLSFYQRRSLGLKSLPSASFLSISLQGI